MTMDQHVEPLLQSIAKAERHIRSEYGTRMVGVMDTIGAHPHFAMPQRPGSITVLSGRDEVDVMYRESVNLALPQGSRLLSQLATDWYVFVDNVPTRLWVEDDTFRTVQTVTMFATDDVLGLTGEYAWQRLYPPRVTPSADGGIPLPQRELDNLELHQRLLDAICACDTAALAGLLDPACVWAQRLYPSAVPGGELAYLRGIGEVAGHVAEWHAAMSPRHVTILNRRVTDWYVFCELLWVVEPAGSGPMQYRTASILPVSEQGLFEGALGFGRDMSPLSPTAATRMGLSFYPEGVSADTQSRAGFPEG